MSNSLHLHYAPDNASLCVRLALEATGRSYQTILVDRGTRAQKSQAFLALNPNGLIPVLETPAGPMFETGAILLWLTEDDPKLIPQAGTAERAHALQWMVWLSISLHTTLRMIFYPDQHVAGDTAGLLQSARKRLNAQLDILNNSTTAPWLDTSDMSAHACYLGPMLRWAALYGDGLSQFDLRDWPRLSAFAKRIEVHPVAVKCAEAEGLGPTPFSAPQPCNPPEGRAL